MNKYYCSDGSRISEAQIKQKLSQAYREKYAGLPHPRCEETGLPAQGSSHIISKARCKTLLKTELIWNPDNFFPATHDVNSRWESNDTTIKNYDKYMEFVRLHDPEGYQKRLHLSGAKNKSQQSLFL